MLGSAGAIDNLRFQKGTLPKTKGPRDATGSTGRAATGPPTGERMRGKVDAWRGSNAGRLKAAERALLQSKIGLADHPGHAGGPKKSTGPDLPMRDALIVSPLRTPIGKFGGALAPLTADVLAAEVIKALVARTGISPDTLDEVIVSQSYASSEAPCMGRYAALLAGLPVTVPGYTVDRRCGSGLQALINAATAVQTGVADAVLAALKGAGLRAAADLRNEKITYKVREHSLAKVPVMFVVGKREAEERTVSVRRLGSQAQEVLALDAAIKGIADEAVPPDLAKSRVRAA